MILMFMEIGSYLIFYAKDVEMKILETTYTCKGWTLPVNNFVNWERFRNKSGWYTPVNDNLTNQRRVK